jgi:hypothetical protein
MSATPRYPAFANTDDFTIFLERLEIAFCINKTIECDKSSILLNQIDKDVYTTLRCLCAPTVPGEKTYAELCGLLQRQLIRETSAWKERRKFFNANQRHGECVNDWYLRLKTLSTGCKFGAELSEMIKCKLICGFVSNALFKIFSEHPKNISLEDVLRIAMDQEASFPIMGNIVKPEKNLPNAQDVSSFEKNKKVPVDQNTNEKKSKKCETCGFFGHDTFACRYKNSSCRICHQFGHTQKMCPQKNSSDQSNSAGDQKADRSVPIQQICHYCGEGNHIFKTCPHRSNKCECCGRIGHAAKVCRFLSTNTKPTIDEKYGSKEREIASKPEGNSLSKEMPAPTKCGLCGETGHKSIFCVHKIEICEYCNKIGHLKQNCTFDSKRVETSLPATRTYVPGTSENPTSRYKTKNVPNKKNDDCCIA